MDISWISTEAKTIHNFFVSIFYILATILLLIGVLIEYFKFPLGGTPGFSQLIGRVFIACILLVAYPEISNAISAVADSVSEKIGGLSTFDNVLKSAGAALKERSWSWISIEESLLTVGSYFAYLVLYITIFFFDAAIVYCLVLLYIFSPIMIAFYILPQTASLTGGLFRTLFEIATWKIVWAVLGTLLWSTALNNFKNGNQGNIITLLALTLILVFSIISTPLVVKNLISGALSGIASQMAGLAAVGLSAGYLSPTALSGLAKKGTAKLGARTFKLMGSGYKATKKGISKSYSNFTKHIQARSRQDYPDNVIPFPNRNDRDT